MRTSVRQAAVTPQIDPIYASRLLNTPKEAIDKLLAERKLAEFVKQMWPSMDPHPYVHGWHIDAICEHVEAVIALEILRLSINIPPRHMKSLSISVGLCPWAWLKNPQLQFLYSSYAASLSIRDGVKSRRILDSPLYKARWGEKFSLTSDQNTKIRFDNDKGGYRICTSVDGMTTGEGGDVIVIDDANNVKDAESEVTRMNTNNWFDEVMQSRFNNPKTGALISIQQRTHAKDLSGHIQEKYGNEYTYLILPCKFEVESRRKNSLRTFHGWTDPRKKEGELLWHDRFGPEEVAKLENALGPYAAAGQLQQRPAPREGGIIPMDKFQRYSRFPDKESWIRISISLDTALKEAELNAYSVGQVWVETSRGLFLAYVWRKKCRYPELKRNAKSLCIEWQPHEVLVEDKSTGSTLIQDLQEEKNVPVIGIDPGGIDKVMRMEAESLAIESGMVWLPEDNKVIVNSGICDHVCDWLDELEDEFRDFPNSEYKDQVDPMSQYLKKQRERRQKRAPTVAPSFIDMSRPSHWRN